MQRSRPDLVPAETVRIARQLFEAGEPLDRIAQCCGFPKRMAQRLARIHNWGDRRRRPGRATKTLRPIDPEIVRQICEMWHAGHRKDAIRWEVRVTAHILDRVIREQALPVRLEPLSRPMDFDDVSPEEELASQSSLDIAPGLRAAAMQMRLYPIRSERHVACGNEAVGLRVYTFGNGAFEGRSL